MVGGWVKNGRFWRYVIMQWPQTSLDAIQTWLGYLLLSIAGFQEWPEIFKNKLENNGLLNNIHVIRLHYAPNFK